MRSRPRPPRARSLRARFLRDTEGAALIEAALVLPLLLLLLFALVDLSLYAWQLNLAHKAAQLGVRRAVVSDAVAVGPGLTPRESTTYWFDLPPGLRCGEAGGGEAGGAGPCPAFAVRCGLGRACTCPVGRCGFAFSLANLAPILAAMRAVLPRLEAENVEITYATNGLGYVGRPPPVPVDVTVRLVGLRFEGLAPGGVLGAAPRLEAQATLPSEGLTTR